LERALQSVINQKYTKWECSVLNDDPLDRHPSKIVKRICDTRIKMFKPEMKRGPACAFNQAFRIKGYKFGALLEDDNWWEPEFLIEMLKELKKNPDVKVAVGNETIWKEQSNGEWIKTNKKIWKEKKNIKYYVTPIDACGSAKICNSSTVWRYELSAEYVTPENIPVDVTEHFRERVLPQPFLLVRKPLVNYAETVETNRDKTGIIWGEYQILLIGTCFASIKKEHRIAFARALLHFLKDKNGPRSTSLLMTGLIISEARSLLTKANWIQKIRFAISILANPKKTVYFLTIKTRKKEHWNFLLKSPFNLQLEKIYSCNIFKRKRLSCSVYKLIKSKYLKTKPRCF